MVEKEFQTNMFLRFLRTVAIVSDNVIVIYMELIPAMTAEADELKYTEQENHRRGGTET